MRRISCCGGGQLRLMSPGDIFLSIGPHHTTIKGRAAIGQASKIIGTNSAAYLLTKHRKGLLGGRSTLRKRVQKTLGLLKEERETKYGLQNISVILIGRSDGRSVRKSNHPLYMDSLPLKGPTMNDSFLTKYISMNLMFSQKEKFFYSPEIDSCFTFLILPIF